MVAEARLLPLRVGTSAITAVTRTIINMYKILRKLHCICLYGPSRNVYSSGWNVHVANAENWKLNCSRPSGTISTPGFDSKCDVRPTACLQD